MAEIYSRVFSGPGRGLTIQGAMGRVDVVQDRMKLEAMNGAERADALLKMHRVSGNSRIMVQHGKVDYYVILDDERGLKAAMSIEYGRNAAAKSFSESYTDAADEDSVAHDVGSKGLFILHEAMKFSHGSGGGTQYKMEGTDE